MMMMITYVDVVVVQVGFSNESRDKIDAQFLADLVGSVVVSKDVEFR